MSSLLSLRLMTRADIPFADSLRSLAGWNQTPADWVRFLKHEPDGCFVAEWEGRPVGTATTTTYGTDLAWIGMVLVHPDARRKGIGRALMDHCIGHLRGKNLRCIKLDASPMGQPLYSELGFREEWGLHRWEVLEIKAPAMPSAHVRPMNAGDWATIEALDRRVFGVDRSRMLHMLAAQDSRAFVYETSMGQIGGYGLMRSGSRAVYLGPVVADSPAAGSALVNTLISSAGPNPIFWDIPDQNTSAVEMAKFFGFTPQRSLVRMFLGENHSPGNPLEQFAIAAPEIG